MSGCIKVHHGVRAGVSLQAAELCVSVCGASRLVESTGRVVKESRQSAA